MGTNTIEIKQEPLRNNVFYTKVCDPVLKEELKFEIELFQASINDTFTDYNDLVLEAPRICTKCDQIFPNSFTYLQHNLIHIQVNVPKIRWLVCHRCPEKFPTKSALEKHITSTHLKLKPHENELKQCEICDKIFSKKYWYAHKTIHKVNAVITCDLCNNGKIFKTKVTFKRHLKTVHEKKAKLRNGKENSSVDFECDKCPKVFQSKDCLQHHVKNCHILMQVKCDLCGAMFKNKSYLSIHISRVHYDDGQLYPCDICGKTFKAPRRVRIHKKYSHKLTSKPKFEHSTKINDKCNEL